jgi:dienelactone hydrolase
VSNLPRLMLTRIALPLWQLPRVLLLRAVSLGCLVGGFTGLIPVGFPIDDFANVSSVVFGQSSEVFGSRGGAGNAAPSVTESAVADPIVPRIRPRWVGDQGFWYTKPIAKGEQEWVWVEPATRKLVRAESLEALEKATGVALRAPGNTTGRARIEPSETLDEARIDIAIRNALGQPVDLFWVDFEGNPQPYGRLAPGESRQQSTFAGHSWLATDENRNPVWTGKGSSAGETLEIQKLEVEPSRFFSRRGRGRRGGNRPQETPSGIANPWQVVREDHQLLFKSAQGQSVLSTAELEQGSGDQAHRYDQPIFWSPDYRFAFTLQMTQGDHREITLVESSPKDQLQPKLKTIRYDKPGDKLDQAVPRLFDLVEKKQIPLENSLFENPWSIDEIRWETDGSRVTFLYNQRGHQVLRLVSIDPKTGQCTSLIEEQSPTYIDYAAKAYRERIDESNEMLWGSERDGYYHLYRYSLTDGKLLNQVTKGAWVVRSVERIDREKRQIWFYAGGIAAGHDPYYKHFCRVDFDGNNLFQLTDGEGTHEVDISPDGQWLIDTYSRVDMPPVHELLSAQTGEKVLELERSDSQTLWTETSKPIRWVAKGRDGQTDIHGILVRPAKMEPGKKYPVIENIYAGPQDSFVPKAYSALNEYHALADQGFIVVKIDGMGTSNRSKAFHDVSYRNLSDGGFPDRILWMQSAAKQYPEMDLERVGIYGGSAGGQNALAALLFFGDFYDVAVADCGCHDNRMDKVWWNELYMGWPIGDHYAANSNVVNAHKLKGKLQLVVGELDTNVDPSSTMQVVDALIKADKDFDLLYIPGGGHGIGSSAYGKRRRDAFFRLHLHE